jgi:hypothetical protein
MTTNELLNTEFLFPALCMKTFETIMKPVRVVGVLDGPGADRRDYCTVTGLQDWEIDMPLDDFLKKALFFAKNDAKVTA